MPYIKKDKRKLIIDEGVLRSYFIETPGELNFAFTYLINSYLVENESYQTYNDIIGALEGCKLELYRRKIVPYEDTKIKSNGDVY